MKRLIIIILLLASITAALTYPFISSVVVEDGNSGERLAYFKMKPNNPFSVKYIHSIHKTPVLETYHTNKKGEIIQTEMQFEEFGIGMPSGATGREKFIEKDGKYILSHMNRHFTELNVRVGQIISNHTFIIKGKKYPFSEFSKPGSWVRIKTDHLNFWQWMMGGKVLGEQ
ncbi:DUF1850 domain-containing protein [Bacillus sp. NEB1478]|uniref:DUF1850 domain-containing protein n=1 Tax=Bacillus sp. NEB1478 TaxID=3073816 RepID=UPI002873E9E4|nr:DUF1850 domain-containing protein [Bacillus sp. NEB1478]WNB92773.1 DUF1850 domain-containing protein [Bacillus sp. NEB1478]